jgi:hypothetical protein
MTATLENLEVIKTAAWSLVTERRLRSRYGMPPIHVPVAT